MHTIPALILLLADPPVVTVTADNTVIRQSCSVRIATPVIEDTDGDGVVHIIGDDLSVDFDGAHLIGAPSTRRPDTFAGLGVVITGSNVTITGARVSGFKVGVYARQTSGLSVLQSDLSGNFRQRLRSTRQAEDVADWLSPHANDANEWLDRYGAALYIEDSTGVTVRDVRVRNGQNGIILDSVNESRIFDNDCSFLSGWGLAMWRSSRNLVAHNAFDFCVRGYSHGVYNRGQDSAGILAFEQCSENVFGKNSATHCGDGFFAFAGKEALGQTTPHEDPQWYADRGNNENLLIGNDFSYAAAHGIELTFSFDNQLMDNRLVENAICGVWGGYSHRTLIAINEIEGNGAMGYGLERGGINIEHGCDNRILRNRFINNRCGVHLWWDEDVELLKTPWAAANGCDSSGNQLLGNTFTGDKVAIQLRRTHQTTMANVMNEVGMELDADTESIAAVTRAEGTTLAGWTMPALELPGSSQPVGARADLRGRANIVMTEWGPWDHESPLLQLVDTDAARGRHTYDLRGDRIASVRQHPPGGESSLVRWTLEQDGRRLVIAAPPGPGAYPYHLDVTTDRSAFEAAGCIVRADWIVRVFPWTKDPREQPDQWHDEAAGPKAVLTTMADLKLIFGSKGPGDTPAFAAGSAADLPTDRFGTMAETVVPLPAGKWSIATRSDDGIRVWLDDALVIDDWTWHAPRAHEHTFNISEPRSVSIRVEHFELDGYAVLTVDVEVTD